MLVKNKNQSRKMRALYLPDWRKENPYLSLLARAVSKCGVEVEFQEFQKAHFALRASVRENRPVEVVHIHWIDDLISPLFWSKHPLKRAIRVCLLCADILSLRFNGIRVVWTIHNIVSHESPDPEFEVRVRRMIARTVDRVIVHSKSALQIVEQTYRCRIEQKAAVIPHGNYLDAYELMPGKHALIEHELGFACDELVLLFFGTVRRYKGVSTLLRSFGKTKRGDLRLVIAGRCDEAELETEIMSAAENDQRIVPLLRFISTEELPHLFKYCDVAVLPFVSVLTSGSAILAMSFGKTLILPESAHVLDLGGEPGIKYFSSAEELPNCFESLEKQHERESGAANLERISALEWDEIGRRTVSQYER